MHSLPLRLALLSCVFLIPSCGWDDSANSCIVEGVPSGTIPVRIGCGDPKTKPIYLWEGADAFIIEVARTPDPDNVVWEATSTSTPADMDRIKSPVTHGERPDGAIITNDTESQLTIGIEYLVKISRISGEFGSRKFSIQP